jgi:hypothetical protein
MPEETKTFKGYSKTSIEEALQNAIDQVPDNGNAADALGIFSIVQMGKEIGGIAGRNDFFVVISAFAK